MVSVDQNIQRDIAAAILDQRMPPGTKLPELRLGQLYDVSRTVVRKALFRLSDDKLIDIRPNCGATVARPTVQEARDVFEGRRLIESALLERSIPEMTSANRRKLRELLAADHAAHGSRDRRRMIRASGAFHLGLAKMSTNVVLYQFLEQLIGRTSLIIGMYSTHITDACSHNAHKELVSIIERGNVHDAKEAMVRHLLDCERQLDLSGVATDSDLAQMLGWVERQG